MSITLQQLQIFRAVALTGSFTTAKRTTGLSQPAISQSIAKFEKILGTNVFIRGKKADIELTPAGEFWLKESKDIAEKFNISLTKHRSLFSQNKPIMKFGITPSLSGKFSRLAARLINEDGRFGRFELLVSPDSNELIELLITHNINAAIVNEQSVLGYENFFDIQNLFTEEFVWAVPKSIPLKIIKDIVNTKHIDKTDLPHSLNHYTEVTQGPNNHFNFQKSTEEWYRKFIPNSKPFYKTETYRGATDFVAEGLATCHCPFSLVPGIHKEKVQSINWIRIGGIKRTAVFIMPNHLKSLDSFVKFKINIAKIAKKQFSMENYTTFIN